MGHSDYFVNTFQWLFQLFNSSSLRPKADSFGLSHRQKNNPNIGHKEIYIIYAIESRQVVKMTFDTKVFCYRLNIKMSYQYRDPHVKDKTVTRPPYL